MMDATDRFDSLIRYYAELSGRDPRQVKRQIRVESAFKADATSPVGARGLMQFMPATWPDWGRPGTSASNPEESIAGGCRYMRMLQSRYHGDLARALAAYNWGVGHVDTLEGQADWLDHCPPENRAYVTTCLDFTEETL